ncbi:cytochrome aa3 quinol oxidase subunit III, partial [Staphylococcus aureus]|nr:cytochrome aa3 quinol oxidase subunit III [Staphylococcus aureus]
LFGTLFATLLTLQHGGDYAGKMTTELFELPLVLIMTFALLISSYTCGISIYYMRKEKQNLMMFWMILTVLLGLVFVGFEIYEFAHYVSEGVTPQIGS